MALELAVLISAESHQLSDHWTAYLPTVLQRKTFLIFFHLTCHFTIHFFGKELSIRFDMVIDTFKTIVAFSRLTLDQNTLSVRRQRKTSGSIVNRNWCCLCFNLKEHYKCSISRILKHD